MILAHLPLTLVCLDGLGNLSEKHPSMATTAVACLRYSSVLCTAHCYIYSTMHYMQCTHCTHCTLYISRDFLINPSDILTQLYSSSQRKEGFNKPGIKGDHIEEASDAINVSNFLSTSNCI